MNSPKFQIVKATDGTFLLFYTGDTYEGSMPTPENPNRNDSVEVQGTQQIGNKSLRDPFSNFRLTLQGMAYASSIEGPYTRIPGPIISPRSGKWDNRMTTNPAVTVLR